MKRIAALLVFVALPLFAADSPAPWPQKGEVVFLSVALPAVSQPAVFGFKGSDLAALASCSNLVAKKPSDGVTILRDDSGADRRLEGDWSARMHRTETECRAVAESRPMRARADRHKVRSGVFFYVLAGE